MPKIRRSSVPKDLFQHLVLRVRQRGITASDLEAFTTWVYANPTVPEGPWFKRFSTFVVCGQGELVKTFLTADQTAVGEEIE